MPKKLAHHPHQAKPDIFDLEPAINCAVAGCAVLSVLVNASDISLPDTIMWAIDAVRADIVGLQVEYMDVINVSRSNKDT